MYKKIVLSTILLVFGCSLAGFSQTKTTFAHLNVSEIYKLMPGVDTAQQRIAELQEELTAVGTELQNEFQQKYEEYTKLVSTYSPAVAKAKEEELNTMYSRIKKFSQEAEEEMALKQQELLQPFQKRILDAVKVVAQTEGYAYVFDVSTISFSEGGNDITAKVKTQLGIK